MDRRIQWINNNQWIIDITIFLLWLLIARISWFFRYIKQSPKLIFDEYSRAIPSCYIEDMEPIQDTDEWQKVSRMAFLIWLNISNIGLTPTTIRDYKVVYKDISWRDHILYPISMPTPLSESLGENKKIFLSLVTSYPHLWAINSQYIWLNACIQGFVYFNINFKWDFKPKIEWDFIDIVVNITDITWHTYKHWIKAIRRDKQYIEKYIKPEELLNGSSYITNK